MANGWRDLTHVSQRIGNRLVESRRQFVGETELVFLSLSLPVRFFLVEKKDGSEGFISFSFLLPTKSLSLGVLLFFPSLASLRES